MRLQFRSSPWQQANRTRQFASQDMASPSPRFSITKQVPRFWKTSVLATSMGNTKERTEDRCPLHSAARRLEASSNINAIGISRPSSIHDDAGSAVWPCCKMLRVYRWSGIDSRPAECTTDCGVPAARCGSMHAWAANSTNSVSLLSCIKVYLQCLGEQRLLTVLRGARVLC